MPDIILPLCATLGISFISKALKPDNDNLIWETLTNAAKKGAENHLQGEIKAMLAKLADSSINPETKLPRNHDLQRASRDALREAAMVALLECAGKLDKEKPWLPAIMEHIRQGKLFKVPLIEARDNPQREWLVKLQAAISSEAFKDWHDRLQLSEENVRQCFRGGQCELTPVLAPKFLAWAREQVQAGTEPPDFQEIVEQGWAIKAGGQRTTLMQAYCLFFREHLKHRPEVFRIFVADHLTEVVNNTVKILQQTQDNQDAINQLLEIQRQSVNKQDFETFQKWTDTQLGELTSLMAQAKAQLDALAQGQRELTDKQGEILVAITVLSTEVERGNATAKNLLDTLKDRIDYLAFEFHTLNRKLFGLPLIQPVIPEKQPLDAGDLWILEAIHRSSTLIGRDTDMESLVEWLKSEDNISVRLLVGDAGAGKTRMGFELIWRAAWEFGNTWDAGCLTSLNLRQFLHQQTAPNWSWDKPTLVVIDYARASTESLCILLEELARRKNDKSQKKFRLLLLERKASATKEWIDSMFRIKSSKSGVKVAQIFHPPEPQQLTPISELLLRRELFVGALMTACEFRNRNSFEVPELGESKAFDAMLARADWSDPLVPMMAALAACERCDIMAAAKMSRTDIAFAIAETENLRVLRFGGVNLWGSGAGILSHFSALAVLADGFDHGVETDGTDIVKFDSLYAAKLAEDESMLLGMQFPGGSGLMVQALCKAWARPDGGIAMIQPDLIAEAYVIQQLARRTNEEAAIKQSIKRIVAKHERAVAGLILRAFQNFGAKEEHIKPLESWAIELIRLALTNKDYVLLTALDDAMPRQTIRLADYAVQVTQALYHRAKTLVDGGDNGFLPEQARLANNLSVRLSNFGRRAEALTAAQESVALRRALAQQNPDAYNPDLAMSLNNVAAILSAVGRRAEALTAAQEAAALYRSLAQQNPDAYNPNLAMSLNNVSNLLSEVGRRAEALTTAQEAMALRRALAQQNPDAYTPNLAMLLNNVANLLSEVGRRAEALTAAQEAVALYRSLAEQNPDAYNPNLAQSLNTVSNRLSEVGRRAEALTAAQESVALRRALAQQNPDAYTLDLARSLNNVANRLCEVGRRAEALTAAQESVALWRALAQQNPAAYTPNLAMSLGMMGQVLDSNKKPVETMASFREGIECLTPHFQNMPQAYAGLIGQLVREYLRVLDREPDFEGAEAFLVSVLELLKKLEAESGGEAEPPATT